MEPGPTVQVPATGPLTAVFAVGVLPDADAGLLPGGSDSAAGALLKKWM